MLAGRGCSHAHQVHSPHSRCSARVHGAAAHVRWRVWQLHRLISSGVRSICSRGSCTGTTWHTAARGSAHTAHSTAAGGTWQHTQLTAHVAQAQAHGTKYHRPLAGVPCPSSCAGQATAQTPRGLGLSRRPGSYVGTLCWCLLYWWLYVGAYSKGWLLSKGWCAVGHLQNEV